MYYVYILELNTVIIGSTWKMSKNYDKKKK